MLTVMVYIFVAICAPHRLFTFQINWKKNLSVRKHWPHADRIPSEACEVHRCLTKDELETNSTHFWIPARSGAAQFQDLRRCN